MFQSPVALMVLRGLQKRRGREDVVMTQIRCAIYTRKSSEEGLDQEFNSLHAQREACSAYIASQKHEGWRELTQHYDDGGLSGGTLERPALQRLMEDVDAGRIDQIVVYKIDRLTRSLADFAKLVDRLDLAKCSFVSVTQSFNTATSMGRLTLNVLLSFAQFEREVTAERIRDKIAASKAKGMWMGGTVPLGYKPKDRSLVIIEEEAEEVRRMFELYDELGTLDAVLQRLHQNDNTCASTFTRTRLHTLLRNPIYAGRIRHKDQVYEGRHEAIIEQTLWDRVQDKLQQQAAYPRRQRISAKQPSPLIGLVFDQSGKALTPTHTNKNGRRLRYYVSNHLVTGRRSELMDQDRSKRGSEANARPLDGWRLPAPKLEQAARDAIKARLSPDQLSTLLRPGHGLSATQLEALHHRLAEFEPDLPGCIDRIDIEPGQLRFQLDAAKLAEALQLPQAELAEDAFCFVSAFTHRKRGQESRIVLEASSQRNSDASIDRTLIANIARARGIYQSLKCGQSFDVIAKHTGTSKRRLQHLLPLAFLAPDIVDRILSGQQPTELTSQWLKDNELPSDWDQQQRVIAGL
jgi:DNA invertase Pin-like site-specific DNA recombinase